LFAARTWEINVGEVIAREEEGKEVIEVREEVEGAEEVVREAEVEEISQMI